MAVDPLSAVPSAAQDAPVEPSVDPASGLLFNWVSNAIRRPVRWLWPDRIPLGKISIIAGNPGLGKSQLTALMAAQVTTGGVWPVEGLPSPKGQVIILSAEDDLEDTIAPRLDAAGADTSKIAVVHAVQVGRAGRRALNLKSDGQRLAHLIKSMGNVILVVIDPISAYLGDTESHNNAEVRALLAPLSDLAAKHGVAIVAVSHFNKSRGGEAVNRVSGSLGFIAAARAGYAVVPDPQDESRRLFLPIKSNVGRSVQGLAFSIKGVPLQDGIESSRVVFESQPVAITAEQALAAIPGDDDDRTAAGEAGEFLLAVLAGGPLPASEVFRQARMAGHSERTVRRAQKSLGIKPHKLGMDGGWAWSLPEKMANLGEGGQSN